MSQTLTSFTHTHPFLSTFCLPPLLLSTPPTTSTTMFRQICLLAVAFLAVTEANHNKTVKSVKESRSCGSSNKKSKTATFCVQVPPPGPAIVDVGRFVSSYTEGALFDCDDTVSGYCRFLACFVFFLPFFSLHLRL
jgi:hypothetical protein